MSEDTLGKVNVRVQKDLHNDLNELVPWGMRRHLIEACIRLVVDAVKRDGLVVIGAILAGRFSLVRTDQDDPPNFGKDS